MGSNNPKDKVVLVVDDDPDILQLLQAVIQGGGFRVVTAATGEEALQLLSNKPDAVILDLAMPGCGGLGVLRHLKTVPAPLPAIVVITAHTPGHPAVAEARQDPNVTQFLSKPIDGDKLVYALHRFLETEPPAG